MIRTLLATTALTGLLTVGAFAQDNSNSNAATNANANAAATTTMSPVTLESGYMQNANDHLASKIIGMPVYSSAQPDADQIGDINDLVVDGQGHITAAVIGVGGFLGIGEKQVALGYDQIQWVAVNTNAAAAPAPAADANANANANAPAANANAADANANATTAPANDTMANAAAPTEWRLVVNTTKDALNAAPEFKWDDAASNNMAGQAASTPAADNNMAANANANADNANANANMNADANANNANADANAKADANANANAEQCKREQRECQRQYERRQFHECQHDRGRCQLDERSGPHWHPRYRPQQ